MSKFVLPKDPLNYTSKESSLNRFFLVAFHEIMFLHTFYSKVHLVSIKVFMKEEEGHFDITTKKRADY